MKTIGKVMLLSVLTVVLGACNTFMPQPTQTPTSTSTSLPTATYTPQPTLTPTPQPTATTAPPTETIVQPTANAGPVVLPKPSGKPLAEWEGIPVMPAAIAGEGDSSSYSFIIKLSPGAAQKYYETEMPKHGWNMFATGQGTTGATMLIFMKGTDMVTLSIIPQPDGLVYVMLVK